MNETNEKRLIEVPCEPKAWMTRAEFKKFLSSLYTGTSVHNSDFEIALESAGLDGTAFEDWLDEWR